MLNYEEEAVMEKIAGMVVEAAKANVFKRILEQTGNAASYVGSKARGLFGRKGVQQAAEEAAQDAAEAAATLTGKRRITPREILLGLHKRWTEIPKGYRYGIGGAAGAGAGTGAYFALRRKRRK